MAFVENDICLDQTVVALASAVGDVAIDLLVICAPCQPFSSQNNKRGNDTREYLIVEALKAAKVLQPRLIFFENVPGLAAPGNSSVLADLRLALSELKYHVSPPMVRDAADYGVPQRRRRCIMVAAREEQAMFVFQGVKVERPRMTVCDAIADLMVLSSGEADPNDAMHRARNHQPIALERLRHIPPDGGSRRSLPDRLVLDCHRGKDAFPDVYGRMSWNLVAPTLTTGCCDITKGRFAHPDQDRALTLREAARLQTFPDNYEFKGNASQVARQIGNAVPPAMISAFAPALDAALAIGSK